MYPYMFPYYGGGSTPPDPIESLEKTLAFFKRMKDAEKEEKDKEKSKEKEKKGLKMSEWFMITLMSSSIIQTVVVLWLIAGK